MVIFFVMEFLKGLNKFFLIKFPRNRLSFRFLDVFWGECWLDWLGTRNGISISLGLAVISSVPAHCNEIYCIMYQVLVVMLMTLPQPHHPVSPPPSCTPRSSSPSRTAPPSAAQSSAPDPQSCPPSPPCRCAASTSAWASA